MLARLSALASDTAGAHALPPIPHLEDDLVRRTTERDDFEESRVGNDGPVQTIDVT